MMPLLQITNLAFSYGTRPILSGINLSLAAGELVMLLGPNGSGKSTLLKLALGHLHGTGSVQWNDRPIHQWPRRQFAQHVAYLPQSPWYQGDQTVGHTLRLGRAPYWHAFGLESDHDLQVVRAVTDRLKLRDLLDRPMDELSGGQRQLTLVGRCLTQEPKAILFDEPTTFLDLKHQVELSRLLRSLAVEQSIGVLMASHDLNLAAAFADRIILLHEGKIAAEGKPAEVLEPAILQRVYGLPMKRFENGERPTVIPVL
jgi:iron complex transport system ATP-binding protein